MGKTFAEIKASIKESVKKTKKGEPVRVFSKSSFDEVFKAMLNDPEFTVTTAKMKGGKMVKEDIKPVEEFRKGFLKKIVSDIGVDKHEAEKVVQEYKFTNMDGVYPVIASAIKEYISLGKKFDFIPTENFKSAIMLKEVPATEKDHRNPKGDDIIHVKTAAHEKIVVKAGAPDWLKVRKKK